MRAVHLRLDRVAPGPLAVCTREVRGEALGALRGRVARSGVGMPWWVLGAWARALGAWNEARGGPAGAEFSFEVPMSLRARMDDPLALGNHVAPLVLPARTGLPIEALAAATKASFKACLRRGDHLIEQAVAAPGRYLPWRVFRRVAVAANRTGNATSHLVFLRLPASVAGRVASLSAGRLTLVGWAPYTPVCLRMGAALSAIEEPDGLRLALTYRQNAIAKDDAEGLLDAVCGGVSSGG